MAADLITQENLTKELLKSVFDDACMDASYDSDGDLRIRDGISCFVLPKQDRIRLLTLFAFEPNVPLDRKMDLIHQINSNWVMVRATINDKATILYFDYDLCVRGGITKKALVLTVKRFLSIPIPAIQEHGSDIIA